MINLLEQPAPESRETQITYIGYAFYHMPPEVAVDLFASRIRETPRDFVALGTQHWLESRFKQQVLLIDFAAFTEDELALLRALASLLVGETTSQEIIPILREAEWFRIAFLPLFEDVGSDMFYMYFCRDNQL